MMHGTGKSSGTGGELRSAVVASGGEDLEDWRHEIRGQNGVMNRFINSPPAASIAGVDATREVATMFFV